MPRKRTGYDAACYYDGKLLGRCTKADSDAYTLLMNACGGDAARVLREYAYFSPELKAILEKAALMQADRSRTGGMFHAPKSSPWGDVESLIVYYDKNSDKLPHYPPIYREGFFRFSIGLEDAEDVIADLKQAMEAAEML